MFGHAGVLLLKTVAFSLICVVGALEAREGGGEVCEAGRGELEVGPSYQSSFLEREGRKSVRLGEEYSVISKDNDAYLLLFRMVDHDKQRVLLLQSGGGYSGAFGPVEEENAGFGVMINKYSSRPWSKTDVSRLKELSALGKGVWERKLGSAQSKGLRELENRIRNTPNSVLRIDYTNRLPLEGVPDLNLLPYVEGENMTSSELALYTEKSLIRASDGVAGLESKFQQVQKERHTAYPDDSIRGLIRYYKFNKGSYGEVWRGLAFTEYLSEPFGNCGVEKPMEKSRLTWRRGELVNHELNSLILDALDMLREDFSGGRDRQGQDGGVSFTQGDEVDVLDVVMKKMNRRLEESKILYSVVREVFFGIVLYCSPNVSRFLHIFEESIEDQKAAAQEEDSGAKSSIWLVYRYEGVSLGNLLFEIDENGSLVPSAFWWEKVKAKEGSVFKDILYQIFQGINSAHRLGIIHRDIKPSNIFVSQTKDLSGQEALYVRVGDWGSAMITEETEMSPEIFLGSDSREMKETLYGKLGPTSEDETEGFQPPEVQFRSFSSYREERSPRRLSYDVWSVGIVMLQMVWGNLQVFSVLNEDSEFQHILNRVLFHVKHLVSERGMAPLTQEELVSDSIFRLSLMRLCLLDGQEASQGHSSQLDAILSEAIGKAVRRSVKATAPPPEIVGITKRCTREDFRDLIRRHDPSGLGLESPEALDLLRRLLQPRHKKRISIKEAITHPYFS